MYFINGCRKAKKSELNRYERYGLKYKLTNEII